MTGASSGIGAATIQLLRDRGATVVTADRSEDADERLDVTDPLTVRAAFESIAESHDGIDGVVHSAGILATGAFADLDVGRQLALVDVNLGGTICVAHAALPHLRRSRGSLVMLGSASGFHGPPEYATYGATKAAIISLAQALAERLCATGQLAQLLERRAGERGRLEHVEVLKLRRRPGGRHLRRPPPSCASSARPIGG